MKPKASSIKSLMSVTVPLEHVVKQPVVTIAEEPTLIPSPLSSPEGMDIEQVRGVLLCWKRVLNFVMLI